MLSESISLPKPLPVIRWRQVLATFTHFFFWVCFIFLPLFLIENQQPVSLPQLKPEVQKELFQKTFFFSQFLAVLIFYANSEILLPKLFKRKGIGFYVLVLVSALVLCLTLAYAFRYWIMPTPPRTWFTYSTFYLLISALGISTCFRLLTDYQREHRLQNEQEKVRLQSELSFLRSQISPHFMFNLMNSLTALARKKSDLLEPMIVKMSDLLRYMLYDSDETKVPIDKEINYLRSYVDLQKMRFGNYVKVEMHLEVPEQQAALEPMLLIPFVENAFKHGTGFLREPFIQIELQTRQNKLYFTVKNRFNPDANEIKDGSSGIGLANVRRRLELMYPQRHELSVKTDNDLFITNLCIDLK
jgi:two-component system, LytTR family, sensor kinase